VIGLVLVSAMFVIGNTWNVVLGGAAVCGLATYTFFKRRWWWAGPFWNSWIVALLPLIGSLAMNDMRSPLAFEPTLLLIAVANGIAYASFVVIGYLKDITADRATGYRTFPVVFGWVPTVIVGDVLQLSAAVLYAYICRDGESSVWVVWVVGTLLAVRGQASLPRRNNAKEQEASAGIAATVRSFVWWNMAVVLAWQPSWWWVAPIFLAASEVTLRNRPSQQQI
jgi:4-hydroxybenzoate polyprenyltransferase